MQPDSLAHVHTRQDTHERLPHCPPLSSPSSASSFPTYLMSLLPCADHTLPPAAAARRRPCKTNAMVGLFLCGCVGVVWCGKCISQARRQDDDDVDGGGVPRVLFQPVQNANQTQTLTQPPRALHKHNTDARIGAWVARARPNQRIGPPPPPIIISIARPLSRPSAFPSTLHAPHTTRTPKAKPLDACQPRHHNHDNLHHLMPPEAPI